MTFWILTLLMALIAMGFVCFPLFRSDLSVRSESASDQTLYEARLVEIDKDLELGRLDDVSAQAAKAEEARRLIKSADVINVDSGSKSKKTIVVLAALSLPLFSIPFHYLTRSPEVTKVAAVSEEKSEQPSMQDLLAIAEKRLQTNPDDANGWKAVGPVYLRLGRFNNAINAYENILRLEGRQPTHLISLADVYIERGRGQINDQAKALIEETLSIEEDNPEARFYTGIIALQKDDTEKTKRIWQAMIDGANGDEVWFPVVKARIAELETLDSSAKLPIVDDETLAAARELEPDERLAMVDQMVLRLAQKLEDNPDDKVGWERLVRSYMILNRKEDAQLALESATTEFSDDNEFLSSLKDIIETQKSSLDGALK